MARKQLFNRFLSTDGTTSGTKDMATTADDYYILDASDTLSIERIVVFYQDAGGGTVDEYGNLGSALTTGIIVQHIDNDGSTVLNDLTDGVPIQTNGDWSRQCYDAQRIDWGAGEDVFCVRWTFAKSGAPLILQPGERLNVKIQDDLSLLTKHYVNAQGNNY